MPTTNRLHIISFNPPYWQFSERSYRLVINCSTDSSCSCTLRLNHARSNITFLHTWKCASNFASTSVYFFWLSFDMLVEVSTLSASSSRQYHKILIYLSSSSLDKPDARQNCSNCQCHLGHPSGQSKQNRNGG